MPTFAQLQAHVLENVIDTPTALVARVPELVNWAIRLLQVKHNFQICRSLSSVFTTTINTHTLGAVPADFNRIRNRPYLIDQLGRVRRLGYSTDRTEVTRLLGSTEGGEFIATELRGAPRVILRSEPDGAGLTNFEVHPLADGLSLYVGAPAGEYRIRVPYWRFLPVLSGAGDNNWFSTNADEWIVFAATAEAFFRDHDEERGTYWKNLAVEKWRDILLRDKYEVLHGMNELVPSDLAAGSHVDTGDF